MAFLTPTQLSELGLKSYGTNVQISDKASFYSPELISIGSNVRIDDFCILSGYITLHNYIHISAYSALYGKAGIEMNDFTGLSPRCTIFSTSDDFSGEHMISPMAPENLTNPYSAKVHLKHFVQIGSGSIVLPGVIIHEGSVIGAMSLVKRDIKEWSIYGGIPAEYIKPRKKSLQNKFNS